MIHAIMRGIAMMIALGIPLLFIALALPLIAGKVPRNWLYGVRTPQTLSSDEDWYPANRVGGWVLLAIGAVWLVISAVTLAG